MPAVALRSQVSLSLEVLPWFVFLVFRVRFCLLLRFCLSLARSGSVVPGLGSLAVVSWPSVLSCRSCRWVFPCSLAVLGVLIRLCGWLALARPCSRWSAPVGRPLPSGRCGSCRPWPPGLACWSRSPVLPARSGWLRPLRPLPASVGLALGRGLRSRSRSGWVCRCWSGCPGRRGCRPGVSVRSVAVGGWLSSLRSWGASRPVRLSIHSIVNGVIHDETF